MRKILVIDDEQLIRNRLKDLLELDDFEVFTADCGISGLQSLKENHPQVVLVDIRMPGMDGIEVLSRIKEETEETEVIIMTGHATIDTAVQTLKMGAFGFVSKPIDYHSLVIEIERAFDKWDIREKLSEAKKKLTESDVRFRMLFETMTQGVVHHDHAGRIILANPAAEHVLGVTLEQMDGKTPDDPFWEGVQEDGTPLLRGSHPATIALRTGQPVVDTVLGFYNPQLNGYRWLMMSAIPQFRNGETAPFEVHVTFTDITERKQSEDALKESERRFRNLFERATDGIILMNSDGKIVDVNQSFADMHGYSAAELKQVDITRLDVQGERTMMEYADRIRRILAGEALFFDEDHVHKDGHIISLNVATSTIDIGGEQYIIGFHRDMTVQKQMAKERERLHAQLNQAQKMEAIGTLAGGIAHDFNNILMSVTGFTQVAMNEPDEEERRENLVRVLKSSERARDLVKQILVFSRQVEQERKPLDLVVMVKEALKLLRAVLPSTIEFQKKITSEQVMILGDPTQIHQILMNLSTNAAHSMQEGGVLEVCLEKTEVFPDAPLPSPDLKPGPYAKLVVKDTGKGISPAIMDQIFNPFFTTKSVGEGTGLGLSVVYGIVKSYNGAITVQSELGKGATFNVYLPLTETAMPKDDKSVSSPIPKGSEHLLLVDDEEPVIKPVKKMLESLGYDVTCCMSSVEALDLFLKEPNRFDLVITDMTMPKMTGVKLARKMMDVRPDIPIILCTGYSGMITVEQAKMLGLRAFIMKPILKEELAVVIRDVLDGGE